jgi:hypothetical protein
MREALPDAVGRNTADVAGSRYPDQAHSDT